jgi:hypothetical protein
LLGEATPRATADNEGLTTQTHVFASWRIDDQRGGDTRIFLLSDRPRMAQGLPRAGGNDIHHCRIECVGCYRQAPAQRVEHYDERLLELFSR